LLDDSDNLANGQTDSDTRPAEPAESTDSDNEPAESTDSDNGTDSDDPADRRRARRRTRTRRRTTEPPSPETTSTSGRAFQANAVSGSLGVADETAVSAVVENGPSQGDRAGEGEAAEDAGESAGAAPDEAGEPAQRIRRRRGRRGGRGRGGRRPREGGSASPVAAAEPEPTEAAAEPAEAGAAAAADEAAVAKDASGDGSEDGPTRLRSQRQQGGSNRSKGRGGRRPGAVSEQTRWAINESPPKRMLISAGTKRTQVAVLEQRTLVEHFVTRKEDESIVGNIYLGRVQNVLPGMEAAFVDIGQGRNGVLYAGEVDYPTDTDDLEQDGELPRIEKTLKPGQTVLVQVTKDAMGTKGARLTQHLSLAGRFCVLAPGGGMLGISRKLAEEERARLRAILSELVPAGFGVILRTAAEGATREQLEIDVARLTRIWEKVSEKAQSAQPLEPVYEEPGLVMRVVRDVLGPEYQELVIDDVELAEQVRDYLSDVAPDLAGRVSVHADDQPIFDTYEATVQVRRALEKKVWLPSGGYLIVEKTEAMWVIDVNTGKFVGEDNLEETVLRNNLEAADEIARQLRLRDMGGIIVIDFVDMLAPANRDEVLKRFKRELARDKTKSRVMDISRLGLVQMTRKNVSHGLTETFTTTCERCEGRGAAIVDVFD
jgi:ribonuclease E